MVSLVSASFNFVIIFLRKVHGTAFRVLVALVRALTLAESLTSGLGSGGCAVLASIPWLPLNNLHAGGYNGE